MARTLTAERDDIVAYSEGESTFIGRVLEFARTDDEPVFDFAVPAIA